MAPARSLGAAALYTTFCGSASALHGGFEPHLFLVGGEQDLPEASSSHDLMALAACLPVSLLGTPSEQMATELAPDREASLRAEQQTLSTNEGTGGWPCSPITAKITPRPRPRPGVLNTVPNLG